MENRQVSLRSQLLDEDVEIETIMNMVHTLPNSHIEIPAPGSQNATLCGTRINVALTVQNLRLLLGWASS